MVLSEEHSHSGSQALMGETKTIALHAEQIAVSRQRVKTALVRATRTTSMRDVLVEEDLLHEHVEIVRVPIGRIVEIPPPVRQEGDTTILSVVEERVVVERRLVLKEEVHLRRVQGTQRHVETVRVREQTASVTRTDFLSPSNGEMLPSDAYHPLHSLSGRNTMTEETIVAVFDTAAHAESAIRDLMAANVPESAISQHSSMTASSSITSGATATAPQKEGFWSSMFGGEPDHGTAVYDRSVESGSTVVTVKVPEEHVTKVMGMLEAHHPIDIDERANSYGLAQVAAGSSATMAVPAVGIASSSAQASATPVAMAESRVASNPNSLQLSEEQLAVGKRLVNRGGTRIRRFVVETPVEQQVSLHAEKVTLERHAVTDGRPVTDADFTDKVVEMTESAEEAVVSKTARVVEEVSLRKEASDRVETVRDTLRRDEVEIEQIPGTATATTTTVTKVVSPAQTGTPVAPKI